MAITSPEYVGPAFAAKSSLGLSIVECPLVMQTSAARIAAEVTVCIFLTGSNKENPNQCQ